MKIKKIILGFLLMFCFVGLVACNVETTDDEEPEEEKVFTVVFNVEGERFATAKVKDGEKITINLADPVKEGFVFDGWMLGEELVDLAEYVVTKDVQFNAKFSEAAINPNLSVNDTKEVGKIYTLVIGWWECTDVKDDGSPKYTSYLTEPLVKLFYTNLLAYVKALGATDEELKNISFRNYSSVNVAAMVEAVKADGDVELLIGVGNNVNSAGNLTLLNGNDGKCDVTMGTTPTSRKVAVLDGAGETAVSVFNWIKYTDEGKAAFNRVLKTDEVKPYVESINVTVTVHGDTDAVTVLTDRETLITLPTITVPAGKEFLGFAFSADAEAPDIICGVDAEINYDKLEAHVVDGKVDLYPVFADVQEGDGLLVVYIHASASKTTYITDEEIAALETEFKKLLAEGESVKFEVVKGVNGSSFNQRVLDDIDAEQNIDVVIGGNTIVTADPKLADQNVSVAAGHFANDSRKALVLSTAKNKELAQKLITYLTTDISEAQPE